MDIMRFFPVLGRHAISKPVPAGRPEKLARRLLLKMRKAQVTGTWPLITPGEAAACPVERSRKTHG
jgi:hypothetical protein